MTTTDTVTLQLAPVRDFGAERLRQARARLYRGDWSADDIATARRLGDDLDHRTADMCERADRNSAERAAPSEIDEIIADRRYPEPAEGPGAGVWLLPAIILGGLFWAWVLRDIAPAAIRALARLVQSGGLMVAELLA